MFQPVSKLQYYVLNEDKQLLVCCLGDAGGDCDKWRDRACAFVRFTLEDDVLDVVRDLLANPQIRVLVFEGESLARTWFDEFWKRESPSPKGIKEEHLELVRQFVDLFDEDCGINRPLQPFWPERLVYKEDEAQ